MDQKCWYGTCGYDTTLLTEEKKLVCGLARTKVAEKKNYISLIDKRHHKASIEVPSQCKRYREDTFLTVFFYIHLKIPVIIFP